MALGKKEFLRKGDIVALHLTVDRNQERPDFVWLEIPGQSYPAEVSPTRIEAVIRRYFSASEVVSFNQGGGTMVGTVVATCRDYAWVDTLRGEPIVVDLALLQLAEPLPLSVEATAP